MSPHLAQFNLTGAFDDGVVVGSGHLNREPVFVAAQEGRFLGGAFGEVHGAKFVGLLRAARDLVGKGGPRGVLLLLDTGGVRLQEANAGELSISETIHAIIEARLAGVAVLALIGGRAGAFGGGGIVTACCSRIIVSQHARIGVSGPEVIETNKGVEEFELAGSSVGVEDHWRSDTQAVRWRRPLRAGSSQGFPRSRDRIVGARTAIYSSNARGRTTAPRRPAAALQRMPRRTRHLAQGWDFGAQRYL